MTAIIDGRIISERGNQPSEDAYYPSASWAPAESDSHDGAKKGTLYSLAGCGKHYGWYEPANVFAGDVPCGAGCASIGWTS